MKYWKLMAGRGGAQLDEFLEESKVRIGFAADPAVLESADLDSIKRVIYVAQPGSTKGQVKMWATQLQKFIYEVHKGDRFLVYDFGTRLYHIGEITSDTKYDKNRETMPYARDVRWIGTVSRDQLTTSARNSLGAILSLFKVNEETQKEVECALQGKSTPEPEEEEKEEVTEYGAEVIEQAKEFLKDRILQLSWEEMQELVAGLLRAMGYKTRISDAGPDRGKDVVASPDGFGLQEPRIHVEVKHRKGQMGSSEVRAFAGGLRRAKGLYVSTGGFSREAHYEAERSEQPITLVDIEELARMVVRHYDHFDSDARALLPLKKVYWPL